MSATFEFSVKIDARSLVAFECLGLWDEVEFAGEEPLNVVARAVEKEALTVFGEDGYAALIDAVNALSNELDQLARDEPDKDRRRWYREDSLALSALLRRIFAGHRRAIARGRVR